MANSLLDTVEPVAWAREWEGDDSDLGQYCVVFHEDEKDINPNWFEVYSRETVESLLSQYAKAIETAAIMRAAEWYKKEGWLKDEEDIPAGILALIPQDGRTQLEEFGMRVAESVRGNIKTDIPGFVETDLRAIVTNLIGEK